MQSYDCIAHLQTFTNFCIMKLSIIAWYKENCKCIHILLNLKEKSRSPSVHRTICASFKRPPLFFWPRLICSHSEIFIVSRPRSLYTPLGIMGIPLKPLDTIVPWCSKIFSLGPLISPPWFWIYLWRLNYSSLNTKESFILLPAIWSGSYVATKPCHKNGNF